MLSGSPPNPEKLKSYQNRMEVCLDEIEEIWLEKNKFLTGDDITIADILGACELEQPSKYWNITFSLITLSSFVPCSNFPNPILAESF